MTCLSCRLQGGRRQGETHEEETVMKEKKRHKSGNKAVTLILILIFLAGLSVLFYPSVSDWWNRRVQSYAIASYDEAVAEMSEADYISFFEEADAFNERLRSVGSASAISNPEQFEDYRDILNVTGNGIIGYVTIDKIGTELPIYHGTDSRVLSSGAGHLEGTSFPVGGEGTHCVISAHRGLPSSRLFTDLDRLEEGDIFTVTVLDRVLTYRVDQIFVILPTEIEKLYIQDGKDYCTLMTCTPYGINTHRLLVRGVRIENADSGDIGVNSEAYRINSKMTAAVIAVPVLAILLIIFIIRTRRKKTAECTEM